MRILITVVALNSTGITLPMSKECWNAIKEGDEKTVEASIKDGSLNKSNINIKDFNGMTALSYVCAGSYVDVFKSLATLDMSAELLNFGQGICLAKSFRMIKLLSSVDGINVNVTHNGDTVLHWACDKTVQNFSDYNRNIAINLLLEARANPNALNNNGQSPFHKCTARTFSKIKNDISYGANYMLRDTNGEMPLDKCNVYSVKEVAYFKRISDLNNKADLIFDRNQILSTTMKKDILLHLIVTGYGNPGKNNDPKSIQELSITGELFVNNGKKKELNALLKNDEDTITYRGRLKYLDEKFDTQENLGKDWHHIKDLTFNYLP